jgi:hypothetical protein
MQKSLTRSSNPRPSSALLDLPIVGTGVVNTHKFTNLPAGCFATWAPKLFTHYLEHVTPLFDHYGTQLRQNFATVFACSTFNFGPHTVSFAHTDPGNLPYGWCTVTSLGPFDPKRGGHLVLWDLQLVIEFPPGSTILLPSVVIRHSNVAIQKGKERYSFTQYTAGDSSDGWIMAFRKRVDTMPAYQRVRGLRRRRSCSTAGPWGSAFFLH